MRVVWIPVAGTVAAALAIAVAHRKDEDSKYPIELPRADREEFERLGRQQDEPAEATDGDASGEEQPGPADEPRDRYDLRLRDDGSLVDADTGREYENAAALAAALGPTRTPPPVVRVRNLEGVPEAAIDAVGRELRGRCRFVKDYHAPK